MVSEQPKSHDDDTDWDVHRQQEAAQLIYTHTYLLFYVFLSFFPFFLPFYTMQKLFDPPHHFILVVLLYILPFTV